MRRLLTGLVVLFIAASARADDARVDSLARQVDALTQELDAMRLGMAPADTSARPALAARAGFGPAASKVYGERRGVSIGGYGEALLTRVDGADESGAQGPADTRFDFLRQVLYIGYKFDDHLLLNSEFELEHAGVRDEAEVAVEPSGEGAATLSGEASLEFAYLEWAARAGWGVRGGLLLVPVGLTNEVHEPPVTIAARRPEPETVIIPTTWSAGGVGVFGAAPFGFTWRAYVMEGLDAAHFDVDEAIREGRQAGSQARVTHPALVARIDWAGPAGLSLGGSVWRGDSWQQPQPADGNLHARVTLLEEHARLAWRGLDARAMYVDGRLDEASRLSDALGLAGTERLGREFFGGYVEAGYDVLGRLAPGHGLSLGPYARYEEWDTQEGVDAPGIEDPALHHTATTAGLSFRPHPQVVLKADHEWRHDEAHTERDRWNFAVGYLF